MRMPDWMTRAIGAVLLAATLGAPAALAAEAPAAPYYSVHLATYASRDKALAKLKEIAGEPAARAEKRKSGYLVRFGAWAGRADADAALARYKGNQDARVLQIENPVEWLLASGEVVPMPGKATAAATPAAPGAAPAAAAAPAAPAAPPGPPPVDDATLKATAQHLDAEMRRWLERGAARADGYVYGMDVAPLLLYAAQRGDAALYERLLAAAKPLIVAGDDADTQGFVLWRHKDGEPAEVSGATESLWMARALWAGSRSLKRADDRALALKIVDGYARHAVGQEPWMVRKYYAFGTKSYAGLSVLPNYFPDFVEEAEGAGAAKGRGLARKSYALLQRAVTPSRLLVPMIQPELEAVLPGIGVTMYAPNGLVSLEDSCSAAEGSLRGVPALAKQVLEFAGKTERRDANGRLLAYYHRKDGRPLGAAVLSSTGYACLARLAAATKDRARLPSLRAALAGDMQALADAPQQQPAPLYAAGPLLLAAKALGAL
jgi:hypothetical protein